MLGRLSWSQDDTTLAWVGLPLNWASDPKHINAEYSLFLTYVPTGETASVPVQFDGAPIIWSPTWVRDDKKVAFASWDKIYWLDIKRSYSPFSITVQKDGSINQYHRQNSPMLAMPLYMGVLAYSKPPYMAVLKVNSKIGEGIVNTKNIFSADPLTWSPDEQLVSYITSERSIKIATIQGSITTPITTDQINRLTPFELFKVLVMSFSRWTTCLNLCNKAI